MKRTLLAIALCLSAATFAIPDDSPKKASRRPQAGRYAIVGEWWIDTTTGKVRKVAEVYDEQRPLKAGITLSSGEKVVSFQDVTTRRQSPVSVYSVPAVYTDRFQKLESRIKALESNATPNHGMFTR
jgi:hypothetical protein